MHLWPWGTSYSPGEVTSSGGRFLSAFGAVERPRLVRAVVSRAIDRRGDKIRPQHNNLCRLHLRQVASCNQQ